MAKIYYYATDEYWRKEQKYKFLDEHETICKINWREIEPDKNHNWLTTGMENEFDNFIPIGDKDGKANLNLENAIFDNFSRGVETARDNWMFNFNENDLIRNTENFIETYNEQVNKWKSKKRDKNDIDEFVLYDDTKIKWSSSLKEDLNRGKLTEFSQEKVRNSVYRPFTKEFLYFDDILNHRRGQFPYIFPNTESEKENKVICTVTEAQIPFSTQIVSVLPSLHISGRQTQCFPFYIYNEDGSNRRENITDWALEQFQTNYNDTQITKWDIFYYTYAILHHPEYRAKYAANLKRELPRIPFAPEFRQFVTAGKTLADIHINYETQAEYPLEMIENKDEKLDWTVEKMRYNKDKTSVFYNDFLTLGAIPPEAHEYRLGNRSALDWIVDQYQISTDKRSGITNNPNREDDKQYIVKLVKKIVTVSLETVKIVKSLPTLTDIK